MGQLFNLEIRRDKNDRFEILLICPKVIQSLHAQNITVVSYRHTLNNTKGKLVENTKTREI